MLLFAAVALSFGSAPAQSQAPWVIGIDQLSRLDLMPAFKRPVKIGAVTSYDRTEGNDDGFSGKYSFVRKEGDALVLADLKGPGCITRFHTPTPTDDLLEFYFDGESKPRISLPFRDLYSGRFAPFIRPLVDCAGGGYTSYVPIPYRTSCKVVLHAKNCQFYDLNYATYPSSAPVQTFEAAKVDQKSLARATAVFDSPRDKPLTAFNVPPGTKLARLAFEKVLAPGKAATLLDSKAPGRIASLRLGPSEALAGKDRDILLRITWDGAKAPAILCPAGDFFGYAWGKPSTGSALLGAWQGTSYCNFPMPFDKSAKVELVSLRSGGSPVTIRGEIVLGDTPRKPYEGKFYAVWHRENPTIEGKPFTYLNTAGRGHIVGLALQAQGKDSGNTGFFEGDDITTIDGEMAIHGTGSEDSFNGGWYDVPGRWDGPFSRAFSGCLAYQKHLGRTGGFRFFVADAYSYAKSITQTIEHAPERNQGVCDYCAVTYFYSEKPPTVPMAVPTQAQRRVTDPKRIVFSAGWAVPIKSFAFAGATLSRKDTPVQNGTARVQSMRARGGGDFFGPPFVELVCDLPAAGRYRVSIDAVKNPEGAKVQLFQDEWPIGQPVDLFSDSPARSGAIQLGEWNAVEGPNNLMFKLVGQNPLSKGWGFDLESIVFERLR